MGTVIHEAQRGNEERSQRWDRLERGRPPKAAASLEQVAQDVEDARQAHQRRAAQHETVTQSIRAIAQHEPLSETCLERIEQAARVVPTMQAPIAFVSGYVRQPVRQLDVVPPVSSAMHAHLIPAWSRDRVASMRTVTAGEPLRALAEHLRMLLFASGGALRPLRRAEQRPWQAEAATLADVCQRSSANVEGKGATGTSTRESARV